MIRTNKDGRLIYKDRIWERIVRTAQKLRKLGYRESRKKPNLFYKPIEAEVSSEQEKLKKVKGAVFADLRGTKIVPIWDDPRPLIYYKSLPFNSFMHEFIKLKRNGCSPRVSFYEKYEPGGWLFGVDEVPNGFCNRCGEDIMNSIDWNILREDFSELYREGVDMNIEVNFCEICREMEYSVKTYRLKYYEDYKLCELCGKKKAKVNHHITYDPERILRLCRSCHGKVHKKEFPHPLWKQKRKDFINGKFF
jgi:hypothetical protein